MITLAESVRGLLSLVREAHMPTAQELREHLEPMATDVSTAGPYLVTPVWAYAVSGADDVFVELAPDGEVPGIRVWEDRRGWGTCAEISVRRGTLRELEAVVGPTREMPRRGPLFETAAADPIVAGHRIPVTMNHQGGAVRNLVLRFDRLAT